MNIELKNDTDLFSYTHAGYGLDNLVCQYQKCLHRLQLLQLIQ